MKKVIIAVAAASVIALAGCSGGSVASSAAASSAAASASAEPSASVVSEASAQVDFDGTGLSDTGAGTMTLATAGGTSEGGNVPQVASHGAGSVMQIGLNYDGGDGTLCTVYIDGIEVQKLNAADRAQNSITIQGDSVADGVHKVEMVAMDGDKVTLYKSAEYEIVSY